MKKQNTFTVTFIGADGSGKTTIVKGLPGVLSQPCTSLYMGVSTSSYDRILPTTRLYHAWKRASNSDHDGHGPPDPNRPLKISQRTQSRLKRIIRNLRHSVRYLILFSEEWYRQLLSWWLLRQGQILLYDRHFFIDYYAYDISRPLSFWQRIHGLMLTRWYPRPQLVIFLDAPVEVLFARKGEGTLELLESRRQDYLALREVLPDFNIVDTTLPLDQVMDKVVGIIESYGTKQSARFSDVDTSVCEMTKAEITDYVRHEVVWSCVPADVSRPVDIQVQVTGSVQRPTSRIWFVDLVIGQQIMSIVVKCGALRAATSHQQLPRLIPMAPAQERFSRQVLALQAIDREFTDLSDPRFVSARVLTHDPDRRILIMNRIPGDELLQRLYAAALPTELKARRDLPVFSKMAGKWLRLFHDRVSLSPGARIYVQPSELLDQATRWLNNICPVDRVWRRRVQNRLSECAENLSELPRANLHGDFWPGNILVSKGQIGVIDVLGWAEGPIWLDIGYYLVHLRAADRQVWLQNVAWPDHLLKQAEDEFLAGYFGVEPINPQARCFFQVLTLLAKWSRNSETLRESTGLQHTKKRASFLWRSTYYRSLMLSFIDMDGTSPRL